MIKKYWKYILFFGFYLSVLLFCMATDISQMGKSDDCFSFLFSAKFLVNKYPVPVWNMIGYLVSNLPFGNDGGNLVLFLSVIPAFLTSIFVFLVVRNKTDNKIEPWIASASLMGCCIFFSQSVVTEVYSLLALIFVVTYYLLIKEKYILAGIVCGIGIATHYMTGLIPFFAFMIVFPQFFKRLYIPIIVSVALLILYHLLSSPFAWEFYNSNADAYFGMVSQVLAVFRRGNLDSNFIGIWMSFQFLIVGFGLSLIPMFLFIKNYKRSSLFVFFFVISFGFMLIGGSFSRFVYIVPFTPFLAIAAGLGVEKISSHKFKIVMLCCSLMLLFSFVFTFNIRALDNNPTTARQIINSLDDIEDGSIVICVRLFNIDNGMRSDTLGGHIVSAVEYHNKQNDTYIIPFRLDVWNSKTQKEKLNELGVIIPDFPDKYYRSAIGEKYWYFTCFEKFFDANPEKDIYYFHVYELETQQCELVKLSY